MANDRPPSNVPHFIGIGGQRCGTSFTAGVLNQHPDIWITPHKEVHFFDSVCAEHYAEKTRLGRYGKASLARMIKEPTVKNIVWHINFHFRPMNDSWYKSLFAPGKKSGKLCGEVTPGYSLLPDAAIKSLYSSYPGVKIFYILRNPIDRAWSHLVRRLSRKKNRPLEDIASEEFIQTLENVGTVIEKSKHYNTLMRWEACFPREQILYLLFDDLVENPTHYFNQLFDFLGVERITFNYKGIGHNAAADGRTVPECIEMQICKHLIEDMQKVADYIGGRTTGWLHRCENMAKTKQIPVTARKTNT